MKLLTNMSIKYKIALLLFVPVCGLLFFSINTVIEKSRTADEMTAVVELAQLAVKASAVVHETQKERGMTAGFLGSNGDKFASEIEAQRTSTDRRVGELKSFLRDFDASAFGSRMSAMINSATAYLEQINSRRSAVSAMNISTTDAIGYYTSMNAALLDVVGQATQLSNSGEITRMTAAYQNFLQNKERAGIERAVLTNTFAQDEFGPGMFLKFATLVAQEQTYEDAFRATAKPEAIEFFEERMRAPEVMQVKEMRRVAFDKADTGGFGVDPGEWFQTITAKINLLKEVEDRLSEQLMARAGELRDTASAEFTMFSIITAVAALLALGLGTLLARSITGALHQALVALNDIAEGEGDLTRRLDDSGRDEVGQLAGAFNRFADKIQGMLLQIREAAESINASSDEIAKGNTDLSTRTEEQASSLEETASSMEEMTSTVKQNADNAQHANELAGNAREHAEQGGNVARDAVTAMSEINTASKKIADIISVIDEIAFQTNLLALNAAVEAARAGEQGRGFAVVAGEVRNLAQRSATAAKEIKDLIEDSVEKVDQGSALVEKSGETLEHIVTSVKKVTDIVSEIAAASQEQATGIDQVNRAVMQMDEMTQQNAALVEQAAAASKSMADQATGLLGQVGFFKLGEGNRGTRMTPPPSLAQRAVETTATAPAGRKAAGAEPRREPAAQAETQSRPARQAPAEKAAAEDEEWSEF